MKKLIALATAVSALALVSAVNANAASNSFDLTISGTAPAWIHIHAPTVAGGTLSGSGQAVTIGAFTDTTAGSTTRGMLAAFDVKATFAVHSNSAFTASLTSLNSQKLLNTTGDTATPVTYAATLDNTALSSATNLTYAYSSTNSQPLVVEAIAAVGTTVLAAGSYSDVLTLAVKTTL